MSTVIFDTKKEATIREGDFEIRITIEDAREIRTALLHALKTSDIGDRDQLIASTEPLPAWIDSDGRVMIGGWLLELRDQELVATYRLSTNEERAVGYVAFVDKQRDAWRVTQITPEKIRFRS
jgi:hypothetical protein